MTRSMVTVLAVLLAAGASGGASGAQEKKEKEARKSGKAIGILVAKDKASIEVKADGEEKARKYVPHWVGGNPADGGGPDKKMLKVFSELKVGSRVEVKWEFEERLRALEVKVLHAPPGEKGDGKSAEEARTGKTVGVLVSKSEKFIELRGDGEEKARKYHAFYRTEPKPGFDPEVLKQFQGLTVGSRLQLEWVSTSHGPQVTRVVVLKAAETR